MKRTLTALTLAATMLASGASAFDPKTLEALGNLNIVMTEDRERILLGAAEGTLQEKRDRNERLRLAQEDWEKHAQAGIDLSSANLSEVFLEDVNLFQANLSQTDLTDATLGGANLIGAVLSNANLSGAILREAKLFRADLTNADLSGAVLRGADLTRALMNGAILCNTIMPDGSVIYSGC